MCDYFLSCFSEGWEKLGLFEYYQSKNVAKKQIQEEREKKMKEEKRFKERKRYVISTTYPLSTIV